MTAFLPFCNWRLYWGRDNKFWYEKCPRYRINRSLCRSVLLLLRAGCSLVHTEQSILWSFRLTATIFCTDCMIFVLFVDSALLSSSSSSSQIFLWSLCLDCLTGDQVMQLTLFRIIQCYLHFFSNRYLNYWWKWLSEWYCRPQFFTTWLSWAGENPCQWDILGSMIMPQV